MDDCSKGCQILGDGVKMTLADAFRASSAIEKGGTKHGVVIIVDVDEGKVVPGETIMFKVPASGSPALEDVVARVEFEKQPVGFAGPGKSVGICLSKARLRDIRPFLR
ncbi:MAG: hypothetical protein COV91_03765 [Candidatus Taylorbacteria bacterium CG11_big_fil_rev_8_21_14_0_20_46_11]|uniref:Uncharacterized protein n=1 Tax=Candidatus Taylorbacteria bacterium CG11_big_fil_rev_8_21_14_0_20_46_11 TaxID=1975025 RepID=A0A2H0KD56_9BACT|nr:MAG: hypothetical protein COV91_03765 [Candidatus Taylorbacteria bacterium CG11_big_fil_rev_8_21_14_0_20_46_11]